MTLHTDTLQQVSATTEGAVEGIGVAPRVRRKTNASRQKASAKMAIPSGRNFASCYMELCKVEHRRPLPLICVGLPYSLDFTTDRVKMDDWMPILNSLTLDRSLKSINIRSRFQCRKPLEEINSEEKARAIGGKAPVVLTRYILEWLSHSVSQCVKNSTSLTVLELEGIPFPGDCLAVLCVGLANTRSLQHLSLQRCYIGDSGCELICRTIADVHSIRSLNLSFCELTFKCGAALAAALSKQKLLLYHDAWKESLRYREPDLEAMPGLRRLTLNDNPRLGDTAMLELIESVRDSLWLKALDLQRCGLTNNIGNELIDLLDHNNTLVVLDIRQNGSLNEDFVKEVVRRLNENDAEGKSEYRWLGVSQKDQRTASAGSRKRNESEETGKPLIRTRSATSIYSRKACQKLIPRRPMVPMSPRARRIITKPPLPQLPKRDFLHRREVQQPIVNGLPPVPKVSLHLDLQSRIRRVTREPSEYVEQVEETEGGPTEQESASVKSSESVKVDVATQVVDLDGVGGVQLQIVVNQLTEMKVKYERLLEASGHTDALLCEERDRREAAEAKLRTTRENLVQLEDTVREKESETRGFVLLSQQSLNEICCSFDQLLEMLDNVSRNPLTHRRELSEATVISADIKRRVASVIRKTKSENLRHDYVVDVEEVEAARYFEGVKKFAKSESDMRSNQLPPSKLRVERDIGDNPNVRPISTPNQTIPYQDLETKEMSPSERARAIFASIVNAGNMIELASQVD